MNGIDKNKSSAELSRRKRDARKEVRENIGNWAKGAQEIQAYGAKKKGFLKKTSTIISAGFFLSIN